MYNLALNFEVVKFFLMTVFSGVEEGFLSISWNSPSGLASKHFSLPLKLDLVCSAIERLSSQNIWFSIGIKKQRPEHGRGTAEDVVVVSAVVADIDCIGGVHKEENLPSRDQGLAFLQEIPFKPSILVWSGGGWQAYWMFNEPWVFDAPAEREKARQLFQGWQAFIISRAKRHGWKFDNVGSIEHLFRVPGTFNMKAEPVPVEIVEENGFRYSVEAFQELLSDMPENQEPSGKHPSDIGKNSSRIWEIVEQCAFLSHCRDDAPSLPEPDWFCMTCALCFEGGSGVVIHELSKNYPQYDIRETNKKIMEALKQTGPMTCQAIREKTGFECPSSGCGVKCPVHLGMQKNNTLNELNEQNELNQLEERDWKKWPELDSKALAGFAARFVELATRSSEADPAAVLITFLVRFGVEVGPAPFLYVGDGKHYARIMAVIVGNSSKARKGTSGKPVSRLFKMGLLLDTEIYIPASWSPGPLSSGEGLIYAVRDPVMAYRVDKKTGQGEEVMIDPGVDDKRLCVVDEEFSSCLIASKRDGNTLSTIIRSMWDSGNLEPLTKNNRIKATGAHIGIVSHITLAELNRKLDDVEAFSGFANRLDWVCARRQRLVPFPQPMPEKELASLQWELRDIVKKCRSIREMSLSEDAREMWCKVYPELSKDHSGLVGACINRAEGQSLRLAMIYALLDASSVVEIHHLESALAMWRYCQESAEFIFAAREINPYAQRILDLLRDQGEMSTRDIYNAFSRNISKLQMEEAILELVSQKKIESETTKQDGRGRPTTIFRCISEPVRDADLDFSF